MTKPWRKCKYEQLSKDAGEETGGGDGGLKAPQRKFPIAEIAAEVENDWR